MRTRRKRDCRRYLKAMRARISSCGITMEGKTVKVSEKGMFVRSQKSFMEGVPIEIKLDLPNGQTSRMKGVVRFARRIDLLKQSNGMGIELTRRDAGTSSSFTPCTRGVIEAGRGCRPFHGIWEVICLWQPAMRFAASPHIQQEKGRRPLKKPGRVAYNCTCLRQWAL